MRLPATVICLDNVEYLVRVVLDGPVDESRYTYEVVIGDRLIQRPHKHHFHSGDYALKHGRRWVLQYHTDQRNRTPECRRATISNRQRKRQQWHALRKKLERRG